MMRSFLLLIVLIQPAVNVPQPIEAEASCFSENRTTNSEELWRLTLSPQA